MDVWPICSPPSALPSGTACLSLERRTWRGNAGITQVRQYFAGSTFDLVVNATSASLGGEAIALPTDTLTPNGFAYDMMYGKMLTPFLTAQQAVGVRHLADGLGMLVEQAAVAFALWRGVTPATQSVYNALREGLARH